MVQTRWVHAQLTASEGAPDVDIITQLAEGDKVLDKPLSQLAAASPGIFTKELEVSRRLERSEYPCCMRVQAVGNHAGPWPGRQHCI